MSFVCCGHSFSERRGPVSAGHVFGSAGLSAIYIRNRPPAMLLALSFDGLSLQENLSILGEPEGPRLLRIPAYSLLKNCPNPNLT